LQRAAALAWLKEEGRRIASRDDFDDGDPTASILGRTRQCMAAHKWDEVFDFDDDPDIDKSGRARKRPAGVPPRRSVPAE
jgi:hypothetical protein